MSPIMQNFHIDKSGYPRWNDSNILVHRTVASNKVGGPIFTGSVVHHIDGDKRNFRKGNLYIMSRSNHSKLHSLERKLGRKIILTIK